MSVTVRNDLSSLSILICTPCPFHRSDIGCSSSFFHVPMCIRLVQENKRGVQMVASYSTIGHDAKQAIEGLGWGRY